MLTKTINKKFTAVFAIILILELMATNTNSFSVMHYITKPAIVISLIIFFMSEGKHLDAFTKRFTILALAFSVIGDILLMFVEKSPHFFTFGLAAFLLTHIMYVLVFLKKRNKAIKPIGIIILLLVYGGILFYTINSNLAEMLIPVFVYMLIILTMATTAYWRKGEVNLSSFNWVFFGAIFFMLSDSLLAVNKFHTPLAYSEISIILTYAIAQYFIVLGLLKQQ